MTARKKKTRKEQEKRSVTQAVTRKMSRSQFSLNYLLHYVFGDGGMHLVFEKVPNFENVLQVEDKGNTESVLCLSRIAF